VNRFFLLLFVLCFSIESKANFFKSAAAGVLLLSEVQTGEGLSHAAATNLGRQFVNSSFLDFLGSKLVNKQLQAIGSHNGLHFVTSEVNDTMYEMGLDPKDFIDMAQLYDCTGGNKDETDPFKVLDSLESCSVKSVLKDDKVVDVDSCNHCYVFEGEIICFYNKKKEEL
jgi:hypothetical protein